MKMRELERRTGVSRETIRVYFRHGLLPEPVRPKANVADYSEDHVRAVLTVRELHKTRRLPLDQIRRAMEGDTSAVQSDVDVFSHLDNLLAARMGVDAACTPLPSPDQFPHAEEDALALAAVGAIEVVRKNGTIHLSRVDLQLVNLWQLMREAGFTPEQGFDVSIVSTYVEVADRIARAEVSEFLHHANAEKGEGPLAEMVQKAMGLMLSFIGLLRTKALLRELHDATHHPRPARRRRAASGRGRTARSS